MADGAARILRPSLRVNAVLMVLAMLVLPQLIVVGWSMMERDIGGKLQWELTASADQAADVLEKVAPEGQTIGHTTEERLAAIAEQWGTRIRVIDRDGTTRYDVDADRGTDFVHQVGTLFFGPDGAPTLREFDETLVPVPKRPEVVKVTRWEDAKPEPPPLVEGATHAYPIGTTRLPDGNSAAPVSTLFRSSEPPPMSPFVETGCRTSPGGKLLVCHGAKGVLVEGERRVIYTQSSSRRAVRALYDLRYHLARLSIVMLPLALVFSWWMGRRMVKPLEWLRAQVLEKAQSGSAHADLELRGDDEIGDLAKAFNDLLGALDHKRKENEAFVADLVHEFKNPVAAIRACAETLESGAVDEKKAARYAKILSDSSGRLDALVSQFLELARAEAGMPNEQRTEIDLAALARGIVSSIEPRFPAVRFEVEAPESASVVGVAPRLDSLVRNLVDNAASFAGKDGEVRVRVFRETRADGFARVGVEVADTGPGISEADLPKVFDRFFTKRGMPGRSKEGTGLGLALVKAVAEAHGGEVSARSEPGKGAIFRAVLPATAM